MARRPKPNPTTRSGNVERNARPTPGNERIQWFSAHEYTTSENTLRTPKAEDKPGIGAPSARQERDAAPNDNASRPTRRAGHRHPKSSHERSSHPRRSANARPSSDATPRSRRPRQAR